MRDSRRMQERLEVRLDRVQMIWLTMGTVLAMGLMFAFGVVVGRRAERLEGGPAAADLLTEVDEANRLHKELTFYESLREPAAREVAPLAKPSPKPAAKATAPQDQAVEQPKIVATAKKQDTQEKAAAAEKRAAAVNSVRGEIDALLARGPAKVGEYTVQVSAFQTMQEAKTHSATLQRKGFQPFVVTASLPGKGTWYRVRLGSFPTAEKANEAKRVLGQADIPAWVLKTAE